MTTRTDAQLVIKRNVWKRFSTPTAPEATRDVKPRPTLPTNDAEKPGT